MQKAHIEGQNGNYNLIMEKSSHKAQRFRSSTVQYKHRIVFSA